MVTQRMLYPPDRKVGDWPRQRLRRPVGACRDLIEIWPRSGHFIHVAAEEYEMDSLTARTVALVVDASWSLRTDAQAGLLEDFADGCLGGRLVAFGSPAG